MQGGTCMQASWNIWGTWDLCERRWQVIFVAQVESFLNGVRTASKYLLTCHQEWKDFIVLESLIKLVNGIVGSHLICFFQMKLPSRIIVKGNLHWSHSCGWWVPLNLTDTVETHESMLFWTNDFRTIQFDVWKCFLLCTKPWKSKLGDLLENL